jgi:hypothetical protein
MDWNCNITLPSFSGVVMYAGLAVPVVTVGGAVVPYPKLVKALIEKGGLAYPVMKYLQMQTCFRKDCSLHQMYWWMQGAGQKQMWCQWWRVDRMRMSFQN